MKSIKKAGLGFLVSLHFTAMAVPVEEDPSFAPEAFGETRGLFLEYVNYEEYVYSRSKKTELGDHVELDLGVRYQWTESTFGRLRFDTDPVENRADNKSSKFEVLAGHSFESIFVQVDGEVNTDDDGGISIGFDLDSELTQIAHRNPPLEYIFYPFNFDGEVGREFNTWDVTRIFYIEGAPSTVNNVPILDEEMAYKTIPGLELGFKPESGSHLKQHYYVGLGAATYLYPVNGDFDVEVSPGADRWVRRETIGYKVGAKISSPDSRTEVKYVGHTQAKETGSLLAAAAYVYNLSRIGRFLLESEVTYSKAGEKPYRLNREGEWFEEQTPFQPVYSDYYGEHQDWLGKAGYAVSLRLGWERPKVIPYVAFKYQDKNFIFRERESAHRLRTNDETESHGGLNRYGFGAYMQKGSFMINPEIEWLQARNPVFGNSSDVRQDRILSQFRKDDFLLYLTVSYKFDGSQFFRP